MKKKLLPIHEGILLVLSDQKNFNLHRSVLETVAFLHGQVDCKCPAEFIPELVKILQSSRGYFFQSNIEKAITNLLAQQKECEE